MSLILRLRPCAMVIFLLLPALNGFGSPRERVSMDFGWRFAFGHPSDPAKDFGHATAYFSYLAKAGYGDGPAAASFDDRYWRQLDLPHDWAVEQEFSPHASFSHGFKAIGRNFPERSVGWYRKSFSIPAADLGKRIRIEFDGAFRDSKVWINGHYLGNEPSGYIGFGFDVTDLLNYGGTNVIAVRVDATMEEGWFYEGAGIYRHAWLTKTSPIHVISNGTFVHTRVENGKALISVAAEIVNESGKTKPVRVYHRIVDMNGTELGRSGPTTGDLSSFEKRNFSSLIEISEPRLWDLDDPYLYTAITTVMDGSVEIDRYETSFGVRSIRFDAREGFFLNGKNIKLKGTNNHPDHAGVGAAIPDELQYWRIRRLKEMGVNAYRCSHNPPAPELLEACDRLGMLVLDENRLMRATAEGLAEFRRLIERDRNHPSVIGWSIGNEEWAIENNITGERLAKTLQDFAKSIDSTRVTTAGISGGFRSGISDVLEVMGYNYLGNGDIDAHHDRFPNQPAMGTEEGSTFATRGIYITDDQKHYRAAYDQKPRPTFYSIEEGWKFYAARPWLAGIFIWTGFDYRGEPTPYGWPSITSYFGMMDLCGFPKDNFYYLKSWWGNEPVLHILPHWNWSGSEGKAVSVWVYSNCEEVELFLNKKSQGRKKMKRNGHLEWSVKFAPGTLEARGYSGGKKIASRQVRTSGKTAALSLDPHKAVIRNDGEDLAVVTVSVKDKNGIQVPDAGNEIIFSVDGPGKIIGVGNGDPTSLEKDRFIETIETVGIRNLKEKPLSSFERASEALAEAGDSGWNDAFKGRDYKNLAPVYLLKGEFYLPAGFDSSSLTLFYKNIGLEQSIFINGKPIAHRLKEDQTREGFRLDRSILNAGRNIIVVVHTPIPKRYDWENVNTDPGLLQLRRPASSWKRRLFNGLAQVIVQSEKGGKGGVVVTAKAAGLEAAELKLDLEEAAARPVVD